MKAIVLEKPNYFKNIEKEYPAEKKDHSIVKINAVGICGSDIHGFNGTQPMFDYPKIVGHELAGTIESSEDFTKGQTVTVLPYYYCGSCITCRNQKENACTSLSVLGVHIEGGMQDYMSVPNQYIIPVNNLTPKQTALVEPLSISEHAFIRGGAKEGSWIVVSGIGPIGMGIVVMAKYRNVKVIAVDFNDQRLAFAKDVLKADYCLKPSDSIISEIEKITSGHMATTVYDATGHPASMNNAINYLSAGGTMVFVGLHKEDIRIPDLDFHKRETTLKGSRAAYRQDFESVIQMIESGYFNPEQLITTTFSSDDFIDSFEAFTADRSQIKGVVLYDH